MDVQLIRQDGRIALHPDSHAALLGLPPWHRHAVHHRLCRVAFAGERGQAPEKTEAGRALTETGVAEIKGLLAPGPAADLSRRAGEVIAAGRADGDAARPATDDPDETAEIVPSDDALKAEVAAALPEILDDAATDALEAYFESHFRIDNLHIYRTYPSERPTVSFLWHRDVAPMAQVHIMVYLTPSGPKAGSTSFLDIEQTRAAARGGYHYLPLDARLADIDAVLKESGVAPKVNRPKPGIGDGVAFAAPRVLHRGNLPVGAYRDVLLLVLLPSFMPWARDIEDFGPGYLFLEASKSTLKADPFSPFNPNVAADMNTEVRPDQEPWVLAGELFPPGL